jgi:hypothetical protein
MYVFKSNLSDYERSKRIILYMFTKNLALVHEATGKIMKSGILVTLAWSFTRFDTKDLSSEQCAYRVRERSCNKHVVLHCIKGNYNFINTNKKSF